MAKSRILLVWLLAGCCLFLSACSGGSPAEETETPAVMPWETEDTEPVPYNDALALLFGEEADFDGDGNVTPADVRGAVKDRSREYVYVFQPGTWRLTDTPEGAGEPVAFAAQAESFDWFEDLRDWEEKWKLYAYPPEKPNPTGWNGGWFFLQTKEEWDLFSAVYDDGPVLEAPFFVRGGVLILDVALTDSSTLTEVTGAERQGDVLRLFLRTYNPTGTLLPSLCIRRQLIQLPRTALGGVEKVEVNITAVPTLLDEHGNLISLIASYLKCKGTWTGTVPSPPPMPG